MVSTVTSSASINVIRPAVDWGGSPEIEDAAENLSPDALMSYCQARLDSIDGQFRASFDDQQKNASATAQINQYMSILKQYDGKDLTDHGAITSLEQQFQTLIKNLRSSDPSCPVLPALTQAYNSMVWSGDGGGKYLGSTDPTAPDFIDFEKYPPTDQDTPKGDFKLGDTEMQGYVQTLSDAAGDLNSNAELGMVQIQSLMSQRQTAVTLTTNLVQSLGDQENKIADNIGH